MVNVNLHTIAAGAAPEESFFHIGDDRSSTNYQTLDADQDNVLPTVDVPDLVGEVEAMTFKVLPFGLDKTVNMRDLDPADMDKLVSIKGLVIRATPITHCPR
jgi:DNA replicative helicase MCM subunit Mcm2 (Cdc46/Mcm family)